MEASTAGSFYIPHQKHTIRKHTRARCSSCPRPRPPPQPSRLSSESRLLAHCLLTSAFHGEPPHESGVNLWLMEPAHKHRSVSVGSGPHANINPKEECSAAEEVHGSGAPEEPVSDSAAPLAAPGPSLSVHTSTETSDLLTGPQENQT